MTPFETVTGVAAPLMIDNIDTEILIRIDRLLDEKDSNLGPYCFEVWRYKEDGTEDPDFILNQPPYRGAPILLAGANFGCGSSREHAVKALKGMGIRVIIASSFGSIFYNNCFQNAMLPIQLDEESVQGFADEVQRDPSGEFKVSLHDCCITSPSSDMALPFEIDELRRQGLIKGLDDFNLIMEHSEAIDRYQQADLKLRPWVYLDGQASH